MPILSNKVSLLQILEDLLTHCVRTSNRLKIFASSITDANAYQVSHYLQYMLNDVVIYTQLDS